MFRILLLWTALVALVGCGSRQEPDASPSPAPGENATNVRGIGDRLEPFQDLLSPRGVPAAAEDWSFAPFSDQGSWQGFALPPADRTDLHGAFIGPFLMPEGRWMGPYQARISLTDSASGSALTWSQGENFRLRSLPGSLQQSVDLDGLLLRLDLWFADQSTTLIRLHIANPSEVDRELSIDWEGEIFVESAVSEQGEGLLLRSAGGAQVRILTAERATEAETTDTEWTLHLVETLVVPAAQSATATIALAHAVAGDELPDDSEINLYLGDPEHSFEANQARWRGYLAAIDRGRSTRDPAQILAVKAVQTLVNNWRGPAGRMRHSSLFPSSNVWYFNGFWAWDSWKHAVALAHFDPHLAEEQVRAMFDHQDKAGMIADVVYLDASEDNWRDTKPPLAGWAMEAVYQASGNLEFLSDLYPKLTAYHRFWYADRDHDQDGLCEYGSTDGTIVAARWESGMDNAVRFDDTTMVQNGPAAWSMSQESVDLNAYLYREKLALAEIARALGRPGEAVEWSRDAERLRELIKTEMFDIAGGWFYDIDLHTGEIVATQGPEGWIPLWTGVASVEQAARVRDIMLDPGKFRTFVPFPTVAADHPGFSEGYWRGLVWLDQAYFGVAALRHYGYVEDADALTTQLFTNLEGAAEPGFPLHENYHPLTGAGFNVRHFSWSAAHLLLLSLEAE